MHGLRILSAPDADGAFKVSKAQHKVAEDASHQDTLFLYSVRDDDNNWFDKGEADTSKAVHAKDHPVDLSALYRSFIDRVIETARNAQFQPRYRTRRAAPAGVPWGVREYHAAFNKGDTDQVRV